MCEKLSAILEADRSCFGIGAERQINMCNALEELRQEGIEEGRLEGRQEGRREGRWEGILEGIRATVRTCRNFNISETDTVRNIMNEFSLSQEEAVNYVKKYW